VQAKLLRALEEGQVLPLGASKSVAVDVRVCSASHRELADEVTRGQFREDLYYRVGLPRVELPPLRARQEDLPSLVQAIVARGPGSLRCHASLVEVALTRRWPGNVRELEKRMAEAARQAFARGDGWVRDTDLAPAIGSGMARREGARERGLTPPSSRSSARVLDAPVSRETIERALEQTRGNVTAAAVALGFHRTQLRRLMVSLGIRRPRSAG
jgi:DNA-binding NtrC family response regulator